MTRIMPEADDPAEEFAQIVKIRLFTEANKSALARIAELEVDLVAVMQDRERIHATLQEAFRRIDALEADAKRLDWLEAKRAAVNDVRSGTGWVWQVAGINTPVTYDASLREAIDRAMKGGT